MTVGNTDVGVAVAVEVRVAITPAAVAAPFVPLPVLALVLLVFAAMFSPVIAIVFFLVDSFVSVRRSPSLPRLT
jgi:hypothetical protein